MAGLKVASNRQIEHTVEDLKNTYDKLDTVSVREFAPFENLMLETRREDTMRNNISIDSIKPIDNKLAMAVSASF